ncbi:MAG: hypothetical protein ACK47B_01705 [Armatimonadota bacterium]
MGASRSDSTGTHRRRRRGGALLWTVGALAVVAAVTPLYVSLCTSMARATGRGAHRLIATRRGSAELERLRERPQERRFAVPELPDGRGEVSLRPGPAPRLREARLAITWDERGVRARAEWTTLVASQGDTR